MATASLRALCVLAILVVAGCRGSAGLPVGSASQNIQQGRTHAAPLARSPRFTEFTLPRNQTGAASVALDDSGIPWALTQNAIDRVALDGRTTVVPMPSNVIGLYGGIALGRDKALWFVGNVNPPTPSGIKYPSSVFRLTTSGTLTSYPLPPDDLSLSGNVPEDIASGIDGKLWFTISTTNPAEPCVLYGGISTKGVPKPIVSSCQSRGVTSGPDRNMWVAEGIYSGVSATNNVVSYSSQANIVNSPTLPANSNPEGIATGPDGNLWVTLVGLNAIGRLTTAGVLTTYPLATSNALGSSVIAQQARIVRGCNAMWFVETGANRIGRITMAGKIREYTIPTPHSGATGLAVSSSCANPAVWFVEGIAHKLAVLTP
jgi:virginiamycin B lyase